MGETPGIWDPPKDGDLCGPRASPRGPCAGDTCVTPRPAIPRGGTGTGTRCRVPLSPRTVPLAGDSCTGGARPRWLREQGTGGGTGRVGETEERALGTLGARDRGPGTGFCDQETVDLGDQGTGNGKVELRTKNWTLVVSDKRPGIQDREFGTKDPQSRGWTPPTPGGDMGGVKIPDPAGATKGLSPPAAATRAASSRRPQPAAPGAPSLLLNFPAQAELIYGSLTLF